MESTHRFKKLFESMSEGPFVSVLMPAFNAEKFIAEAVRSILDQDHKNWELLIVDDASTDSTLAIINSFKDDRIKVCSHGENLGYLLSCNELFDMAKGDFITFLDADDTCASNRIFTCLKEFERDSNLHFLTTDHLRMNEAGTFISEHRGSIDHERYAADPTYYPTICCATIFFRKKLLHQVGGYHRFFKDLGGEDYHWLFRLSRAGKGRHVNHVLYSYRSHSNQTHLQNRNVLKYFHADIDREIRMRLIQDGTDLIHNADALLERSTKKINADRSEILFRKASEMLNRGQKVKAFILVFRGLVTGLTKIRSWKRSAYLSYSILIR